MTTTDDRIVITLALLPEELDTLRWALQEQAKIDPPHRRKLVMLDQLVYAMSTQ